MYNLTFIGRAAEDLQEGGFPVVIIRGGNSLGQLELEEGEEEAA